MGVDSGVNQIKLFIQTNQPLLIISVIIVVWFLIYTQISSDTFYTQVDAVDSPEVVSESELTVSVEEQNQAATTELTEYSVDYTCGHAMHREAGGCVINTCECVGGVPVEYLGTTESPNYCPVDGGNSCLTGRCIPGLVEDITSGYGSITVDTAQLDHMECKCDPSKGFKDDIPDTSSDVPMCECDPDLGRVSGFLDPLGTCDCNQPAYRIQDQGDNTFTCEVNSLGGFVDNGNGSVCDTSKGLKLDEDDDSLTLGLCICDNTIHGINNSLPPDNDGTDALSCQCDSPGYTGSYTGTDCNLLHDPGSDDHDGGFSMNQDTGDLECDSSHGLIYDDSTRHCVCDESLAGIESQDWSPGTGGRCECSGLRYAGQYDNGCSANVDNGFIDNDAGLGPVCNASKGLTLIDNQCVCNTTIVGINNSTPYSGFAINQGSCLCDSTGYTGEYNGSTCPINEDGGFVQVDGDSGPVCNPDENLVTIFDSISGFVGNNKYYSLYGGGDVVEGDVLVGRCACPLGYHYVSGGCQPNECNVDGFYMSGESGAVTRYIGGGGVAENITPEAITPEAITTGTNGLCLKHGDTQYLLNDSDGNVVDTCPDGYINQTIETGNIDTDGANIGLRCQIIEGVVVDQPSQYCGDGINCDGDDNTLRQYTLVNINEYNEDNCCTTSTGGTLGTCLGYQEVLDEQDTIRCGTGASVQRTTQITTNDIENTNGIENKCCECDLTGYTGDYDSDDGCQLRTGFVDDGTGAVCATGYIAGTGDNVVTCEINEDGGFVDNGSGPVCDGLKGLKLDEDPSSITYNQCICDTSIAGIGLESNWSSGIGGTDAYNCECNSTGYTGNYGVVDGVVGCPINTAGGFVDNNDGLGPVCDVSKGLKLDEDTSSSTHNQCICDTNIPGIAEEYARPRFDAGTPNNYLNCYCNDLGYISIYNDDDECEINTDNGFVDNNDGLGPVCDVSKGLKLDEDPSSSTHNQCICDTSIAGIGPESNWSPGIWSSGIGGIDAYNCECNSTGYTGNYGDDGVAGCSINEDGGFVQVEGEEGPVCPEGYTLDGTTCRVYHCGCDNGTGVQGTQSDIYYYIDAGRELFNETNPFINACSNILNESDCTNYTSASNRNICVWDTTDEVNPQCRFIQSDSANYLIQNYTRSDPETYTCPQDDTPMCASCDAGYYLHNPNPNSQEQTPLECRKILDYSSISNTSDDLIYPYKTQAETTYTPDLYPNWLQSPLLTTDKIDNPIYGTKYDSNINGSRPLKVVNDPVNGDTIQCFYENHVINPESCENTPNLTPITPDMLIGELVERTDYTGQPWSAFLRVKCPDNSIRPINCFPLDTSYYLFTSQDISNADPEWINDARECYYSGSTTCDGFVEGFANYEGFENVDPDAVYTCGGQNIVCNTLHELFQENTPYMYVDYDSNVYNSIGGDDLTFQMPTDASFGPYQSLVDIPFYETCCDSCLGYDCPPDKLLKPNPETLGMGASTMQGEYLQAEDNCCQDIPESWGQNSCHPSIEGGLYECADLTDSTISDQVDCKTTLDTMMENDTLSLLKYRVLETNFDIYDVYSVDELGDFDSIYYDSYGNPLKYNEFTQETHNSTPYCKLQNKHITLPFTQRTRSSRSFFYMLNNVGNSDNPEYVPIDIEGVSYNQIRQESQPSSCELTPEDIPNEQYLLPEEFRYHIDSYVACQQDENGDYQLPPVFNESCIPQLSEIQDRLSCAPYTVTDSEGNSSDHNLVMVDYDIMFSP